MVQRHEDDGLRHAGLLPDAQERAEAREAAKPRPLFYLVQREGVYGRGIVGIFTTEPKAEEAARAAADEEPDYHHEFACYAVQSNMRVKVGYGHLERDPYVFLLTRKLLEGVKYENHVERPA